VTGKKLVVDKVLCQGFAQCEAIAEEFFRLDDRQIAVVLRQPQNEDELAMAEAAVRACPRKAIRIDEDVS